MSNDITRARTGEFVDKLDRAAGNIQPVLPEHISWERFRRAALTAVQTNPRVLDCTTQSMILALTRCAEDGLIPDGHEAAIIPYKNTAQYVPMVAGLRKLALQTGVVLSLTAECVYRGDEFRFWNDEAGTHFRHVPDLDGPRADDDVRGAYAFSKLLNGETAMRYLSRAEIIKARDANNREVKPDSPWVKWFPRMCEKTAIRRLSRELPRAVDRDDLAFYRAASRDETPPEALAPVDRPQMLPAPSSDGDPMVAEVAPVTVPLIAADTATPLTFAGEEFPRTGRGVMDWANAIGKAAAGCASTDDARTIFEEYGPQLAAVRDKFEEGHPARIAIDAVLDYQEQISGI